MTVTPATLHRPDAGPDSQPFQPLNPYQGRLEDFDYVEEEWFATGQDDTGHPFTTTVLVRRPRDASRFSGTVIVEPLHFFPITPVFMYTSHYIMRSGHAWATIGSQKTPIDNTVKPSDLERYESVNVPAEPLPPEAAQLNFMEVPGTAESGVFWWEQLDRQTQASHAILSQVGAAIGAFAGPFEGFDVRHVLLAGHSYTGHVSTGYIREAHDSRRRADGSPVFDGYFPCGWPTAPFGRRDVPIVHVICEGDFCEVNENPYRTAYEGIACRRPDSDEPGDRYRLYELAGVGHTSTQYPPIDDLKFLEALLPAGAIPSRAEASKLPFNQLFQMALHHLVHWVADGVTPPRAERMEDDPNGFFAKDEHGNTRGGVRCAQMDVPRAKYLSNLLNDLGEPHFGAYGFEQPFDGATLRRLYKDRDDYLERFSRRLDELISEGWFLAEDADEQRADAEKAEVL